MPSAKLTIPTLTGIFSDPSLAVSAGAASPLTGPGR
jgi:hypothetical protein